MYKIQDSLIEKENKQRKSDRRFNVFALILSCFLLYIVYLNIFVFFPLEVVGTSMDKTLSTGDIVIVDKTDKSLTRGDIVIISDVKEYQLIKRVIAVGECTVKIDDGFVYVDGEKIDEPYLTQLTYPHAYFSSGSKTWELKEDEVVYMGDNRFVSGDARENGPCKRENIVGTVKNWSVKHKGIGKSIGKIKKFFGIEVGGNDD